MNSDVQPGATIPGYQVVEKLGPAPSYGVWVRAVQTSMDRHVLMKLLSPGDRLLQEYFGLEIAMLVRRDGDGVLRVIDEGTAGDVRFLVLDEAEAKPFLSQPGPLSRSETMALATLLRDLFLWAGNDGCVLLPIVPSAVLEMSVGFAISDLGWVIPDGEPVPAHPTVPAELVGRPAQRWMNSRFFAASLARLGDLRSPARNAWVRTIAELGQVTEATPDGHDRLADLHADGSLDGSGGRPVPTAVAWVLAAVVVIAVALVTSSFLGDRDPENGGVAVAPENGGEQPGGPGDEDDAQDDPPGAVVVDANVAAARNLRELLGLPAGDDLEGVDLDVGALTAGVRTELRAFVGAHPETEAATSAAQILENARRSVVTSTVARWDECREQVRQLLDGTRVAAAEARLGEFTQAVAAAGEDFGGPVPLGETVVAERRALEARIDALGKEQLEALLTPVHRLRAERRYGEAIAALEGERDNLTHDGNRERHDLRKDIVAESRTWQALRDALPDIFDLARNGRWDDAFVALRECSPREQFPLLVELFDDWERFLGSARASAGVLDRFLRSSKQTVEKFQLIDPDEVIRGKVDATGPGEFTVDLHGFTTTRIVPYRRLAPATVARIAALPATTGPEPRDPAAATTEGFAALLVVVGDAGRGVPLARSLTPPPSWIAEVAEVAASLRAKSLAALLARGAAAAQGGEHDVARHTALELRDRFTVTELAGSMELLVSWIAGYWLAQGPQAAFTGTEDLVWDAASGTLTLTYDFEDGLPRDWVAADPDALRTRQRALLLKGSAWLQPQHSPDSELFIDELRLVAEMSATVRQAPNLNVILWSPDPKNIEEGLFIGLGYKPPTLSSFDIGDVQQVLPCNVVGTATDVGRAKPRNLFWHRVDPVIGPERRVKLTVTSGAEASTAEIGARLLFRLPGDVVAVERRGTVQFRSYESPVLIRKVNLRGRLRPDWVKGWADRRARAELSF